MSNPLELALIPFPGTNESIQLTCRVQRAGPLLELQYALAHPLTGILIPEPAPSPTRQDSLWKHTCLEAFLGASGASSYWEMNLSPSLHWNLYHFDEYRAGMRPEERIQDLGASRSRSPGTELFRVSIDLSALGLAQTPLELGLTAVIERADGSITYWAIHHAGEKPDFHLRASFTGKLT